MCVCVSYSLIIFCCCFGDFFFFFFEDIPDFSSFFFGLPDSRSNLGSYGFLTSIVVELSSPSWCPSRRLFPLLIFHTPRHTEPVFCTSPPHAVLRRYRLSLLLHSYHTHICKRDRQAPSQSALPRSAVSQLALGAEAKTCSKEEGICELQWKSRRDTCEVQRQRR